MATPRAVTLSRAVFIASCGIVYATTIVAASLTLDAYFAQTWDVKTFIQAAHRFLDGGNPFDLYAQSRSAQTWPYAYPPLHALVTAMFLWMGNIVPIVPDYVWARVPALIADLGIGIVLYAVVERKSSDESLARLAMLLWLFNPLTFYDTAVQGHFESEWILFVLLAYWLHDRSRGIVLPTISLAMAVLFKQIAILFALPFWIMSLRGLEPTSNPQSGMGSVSAQRTRLAKTSASILLFALVTMVISLPYLLYSNDFVYMNMTYLENVPVQTQSWLVGMLALVRPTGDAMASDFFLFRYQTVITILAAATISFFAIRRGLSLYLTAALIAIAFFLTSKKVMGYYYVMLFPFLFAEILPRRRFHLALFAILLTAWISLSPYYAPWTNPNHIWVYAILGAINSAAFVWMFTNIWTQKNADERREKELSASIRVYPRSLSFLPLALFVSAVLAALLQPFAPDGGSPIRAPIIAPGAEGTVLFVFAVMVVLLLVGMWLLSRKIGPVPRLAWATVLFFAPLFFVVYYLTKESTALFEYVLTTFGV